MKIHQIEPGFSVSTQVHPENIPELAQQGVRVLINNRADWEFDGQPESEALATACRDSGVTYLHIPILHGHFSDSVVREFSEVLEDSTDPVHAFCEFGTRSAILWALSQAGKMPLEEILRLCNEAQFDLSGAAFLLKERAESLVDEQKHFVKIA